MNSSRSCCLFLVSSLTAASAAADPLPPGFVQGDVVSYSYVPNKRWTINEGYGILPYLCEYGILRFEDDAPLETFHAENVRRIDQVSQWSTAIMLYARKNGWHDEIINLMIRAFSRRQLIILRNYWRPGESNPFINTANVMDTLWANRNNTLTNPEGDRATGLQIINNILAVKTGDEYECSLRTSGLQTIFATFESVIQNRDKNGQQPFHHIQAWYNMLHYGLGCHAASQDDVDQHGRFLLPTNTECIGMDTYHFWNGADPLAMSSTQRRAVSDSWQNVITRYYPGGLSVSPCSLWSPQCRNDTHALLNGLSTAGAGEATLFYIANSCTPGGYHTTPIETMDAFYDSIKAGPWVCLSWYSYPSGGGWEGTTAYLDKTLEHFTGDPYTQQQLDDFHDRFIESRMSMFNDVVHNQFGYLHIPPQLVKVTPDPGLASAGIEYVRHLALTDARARPTWSVVQGPAGLQVDGDGRVHGWVPGAEQIGQLLTITIRAENPAGSDQESWQVQVLPEPAETLAVSSFTLDAESWSLGVWKAGPYDFGTMTWDAGGGNPAGSLRSTGSGATNNTDSCTREGGTATRSVSTAGYFNLLLEYDVTTVLHTPPAAGCSGDCPAEVLEGSCQDKLVVRYSTSGPEGPWTVLQALTEGVDLPAQWTHQVISLTGMPGLDDNPDLALQFKWQFNTSMDTGWIDNVSVKGVSTAGNTVPQVDAGPDRAIYRTAATDLAGTVSDDGLPDPPGQVLVKWTCCSGPGQVTFDDPNSASTSASFSAAGTYVLYLTASDSQMVAGDEVTITVHEPPPLPGKATDPAPPHQAAGLDTVVDLSWTAGSGATSHRVYLGPSNPPEFRIVQTSTTYHAEALERQRTYYWRIDEVNEGGTAVGDVWLFATADMGDFDADQDVDLEDFGHLQACYSGSGNPYPYGCSDADLNWDGDVDQEDLQMFLSCLSGAGQPPTCSP